MFVSQAAPNRLSWLKASASSTALLLLASAAWLAGPMARPASADLTIASSDPANNPEVTGSGMAVINRNNTYGVEFTVNQATLLSSISANLEILSGPTSTVNVNLLTVDSNGHGTEIASAPQLVSGGNNQLDEYSFDFSSSDTTLTVGTTYLVQITASNSLSSGNYVDQEYTEAMQSDLNGTYGSILEGIYLLNQSAGVYYNNVSDRTLEISVSGSIAVPEPSSLGLCLAGGVTGLAWAGLRRRSASRRAGD